MNHSLDLLAKLHQGAMIITPNNRLSNQILKAYDEKYRPGLAAIPKPHCYPYQSFLLYLFKHLKHSLPTSSHPLLLSDCQQHHLWQTIIMKDNPNGLTDGVITAVKEAWTRCQYWQIPATHAAFKQTTQTQQFQHWFQSFHDTLKKQHAITIEHLPEYLIPIAHHLRPTPMIWSCFDEFTPIQMLLQESLSHQGHPQIMDDILEKIITTERFTAQDQPDEYQHIIHWVRERIHLGETRIAIVVPELQNQAETLYRLFSKHFASDVFTISLGVSLTSYPIVSTMLTLLSLQCTSITTHQLRLLLHSPFISGSEQEHMARSQCMQDSLLMKEGDIPWSLLLNTLAQETPYLKALLEQCNNYPKQDTPSAWAHHFKERLTLMGCPGDYPLDSTTYQCFNRFLLLLDDLKSFTTLSPIMTYEDALQSLRTLAQTTIFQIKKPKTPIVILGLLEASGCSFDSIWVSGLTDLCLPQKTRFSAWLPIHLQKSTLMPHTCTKRQYKLADQCLKRLGYACQHIIYSYPKLISDAPQLPSSLISAYPEGSRPIMPLQTTCTQLINYEEPYRLPPKPETSLRGGTSLLASQARCGFQAFATYRLNASPGPELTDGLDALVRGQVLHKIMENVWRSLKNQRNLLNSTEESLASLINESISGALRPIAQSRPHTFPKLLQEVEFTRLKRLVYACLTWEKQRQPFEIDALEQVYTITLASLPFKVRVDRMDTVLESQEKIVIDYKSSLPSIKPWRQERPEAPQLLLYALLDPYITTLLFIQIKTGKITLSGFSKDPCEEVGITSLKGGEQWSEYQQYWEEQLTDLAHEIQEGHCEPMPTKPSHCLQCTFKSLCRLDSVPA